MIDRVVYSLLSGASEFMSSVGDSLHYIVNVDDKDAALYAVYSIPGDTAALMLAGEPGVRRARLQLDIYGLDGEQVLQGAGQAVALLNGYRGVSWGVAIQKIELNSRTPFYEHDTRLYRSKNDFSITYS